MAGGTDLQAALDELFATAPEGFVAARNALVKALKTEKRPTEASAVAALRRPARLAWALNQLALTGHEALDDLLAAVAFVRAGGDGDLKTANARLRDAVNAAATAATARFDPPRVGDRADLAQALLAIVGDEEAAVDLESGRLEELPTPDAFGLGLVAPPPSSSRSSAKRRGGKAAGATTGSASKTPSTRAPAEAAPAAPPVDQLAVRRAVKRQKAAAKAEDSAQRALARAEKALAADADALAGADARREEAAAEVARLEAALTAARSAQDEAEAAAAEAIDAQERSARGVAAARAGAEEAATELADATAEVERLGGG